jgi:ATP-dependent Lon protease
MSDNIIITNKPDNSKTIEIKPKDEPIIKAVIKKGKLLDMFIGNDNDLSDNDEIVTDESDESDGIKHNPSTIYLPKEWDEDLPDKDDTTLSIRGEQLSHDTTLSIRGEQLSHDTTTSIRGEQLSHDTTNADYYKDKYEDVKNELNNRTIYLKNILDLDINMPDLSNLVEEYGIMLLYENDPEYYIRCRDKLRELIESYKLTNNKLEKQKKELEDYSISPQLMESKILNLDIALGQKSIIYKRYKVLNRMSARDNEYNKLSDWLDCVMDVPFNSIKPINPKKLVPNEFFIKLYDEFSNKLYGMNKIKEELMLIVNKKINDPYSTNIIGLVGPPGVGKTEIVRLLSSILNLPFEQISLGGLDDSSVLDGYSYTYEGARCGRIITALKKMKCKNGILFFDEIDKIPKTSAGSGVSNLLIHITDFTQNSDFHDRYLQELSVDLSNIWFIFAMNEVGHIDKVLKDRLDIIKVPGYGRQEKINIAKNHLIPKAIKNTNLSETDVIIEDGVISYIINQTDEKGVRKLKFKIDEIIKKISMMKSCQLPDGTYGKLKLSFMLKNFKLPLQLTIDHAGKLLRKEEIEHFSYYK